MGYADRDEILATLNELLKAEDAAERVALESSKSMDLVAYREVVQLVRKDEAHCCAMLTRHIWRLGGSPSRKTGAFHGKATAITEPLERLAFLNRGQAWIVSKLEKLLPRVRDDAPYSDLKEMADRHRANIDLTEAYLDDHITLHS